MSGYNINVQGVEANHLTDLIVQEVIRKLDMDKLKAEVRNKIVKELKGDILNSAEVQKAISNAVSNAGINAENRIQQAASQKIYELSKIDLTTFKLVKEV